MASPRDRFGAARDSNFTPIKYFRPEDNKEVVVRLLPSMKSLAATGQWAVFHKQHFGYKAKHPKDPTKVRAVPFACIEEVDRKTEMVTTSCPECRLIEAMKKKFDDQEQLERNALKAQGVLNDADIKKALEVKMKDANEWLRNHNVDKKWYINVMDTNGEFGVLQIPHRAKQALDKRREELKKFGIDPFDFDKGVFFVFKRTGRGNETLHTVDILQEVGPTPGSFIMKLAPMTDEQLETADRVLPDLSTAVRRLSAQQIKLLTESSGDPEEVDAILSLSEPAERSPGAKAVAVTAPVTYVQPPTLPQPAVHTTGYIAPAPVAVAAPVVATPPAAAAPAPAVDPQAQIAALQAEFQRKLAALQAAQPAAPAQPATPAPAPVQAAPKAPVAAIDPMDPNMTPEQFQNLFPPPPKS